MTLIIAGLAMFTLTHLCLAGFSAAFDALRRDNKGVFVKAIVTLLSLAGIALIVAGWKGATATQWYTTNSNYRVPGLFFIGAAIYLFVLASRPGLLKRLVRHPQLSGVLLWSLGHLMLNGDSHSLTLFSSLGAWAAIEILLINRREGAWVKPPRPGALSELLTLAIAVALVAALAWAHPWFAGVPVAPLF